MSDHEKVRMGVSILYKAKDGTFHDLLDPKETKLVNTLHKAGQINNASYHLLRAVVAGKTPLTKEKAATIARGLTNSKGETAKMTEVKSTKIQQLSPEVIKKDPEQAKEIQKWRDRASALLSFAENTEQRNAGLEAELKACKQVIEKLHIKLIRQTEEIAKLKSLTENRAGTTEYANQGGGVILDAEFETPEEAAANLDAEARIKIANALKVYSFYTNQGIRLSVFGIINQLDPKYSRLIVLKCHPNDRFCKATAVQIAIERYKADPFCPDDQVIDLSGPTPGKKLIAYCEEHFYLKTEGIAHVPVDVFINKNDTSVWAQEYKDVPSNRVTVKPAQY